MTRVELALAASVVALGAFVFVQARGAPTRVAPPSEPGLSADMSTDRANAPAVAGVHGDVAVDTLYSDLPAPVRDLPAIRRQLQAADGVTYIGDMLRAGDSTLARWPDRRRHRIRVWVQRQSLVAGWQPEYADHARAAFERWELVGLPLGFDFVGDSAAAEVHVTWVDHFAIDTRIGNTHRVHDQHWWIVDGDISVATHTVTGRLLAPAMIRTTTLHEVGHLLGLGHTSDTTSVMAGSSHGVTELSGADLAGKIEGVPTFAPHVPQGRGALRSAA